MNEPLVSSWRAQRSALLADPARRGLDLATALCTLADSWFADVAADLPEGWAVVATAGYADGRLSPGSDLDVMLLHPARTPSSTVASVAERLWYPFWDASLKVSPATHSIESALQLAAGDLHTGTALLRVRHLVGEPGLASQLQERALDVWRTKPRRRLAELREAVEMRHHKSGEVAFLLEPDLKDGRGGLRDVQSLQWAVLSRDGSVDGALERQNDELAARAELLWAARVELQRRASRPQERLLLQEQDAVADALGFADADALMAAISAAARDIAWASDRFWARVSARWERRRPSWFARPLRVGPGLAMQGGEVILTDDADLTDPSLILRVASTAAHAQTVPSRGTLEKLAAVAPPPEEPWSESTRQALVSLLGAGPGAIPVVEALDQHLLFARVIPEWASVRSKPQRNAYHRFTVDRHLLETAVNATSLVREVARPDLLLVGSLLHDIGKGFPGDHTVVGMEIVERMGARMGFEPDEVQVLVRLVRDHLLLPETATRRDLGDPATTALIAGAVGDVDSLLLLRALTEADSLATGATAWSDWKASLIRELVDRTAALLEGHRAPDTDHSVTRSDPMVLSLLDATRAKGFAHIAGDATNAVVVAPDRTGLFNVVAGTLSVHGVEVLSADVWGTDDGFAVEEFRVAHRLGAAIDWRKVERDLRAALAGSFDLPARLAERTRSYRPSRNRPLSAIPPRVEVLIDHRASADSTVVEVRAPDGVAMLFRVTRVLAEHGLDVRHAKVATLGHEVVDAFYVRRPDGAGGWCPLGEGAASDALRAALLAELLDDEGRVPADA